MRNRVRFGRKVVDTSVFPVRSGGWTAHFDIEDHRGDRVAIAHYETGQVFPTCQAAEETAIRMATEKI